MGRESHDYTLETQRLQSTLNSEAQRKLLVGDPIQLTVREYSKNPMRVRAYDKPRTTPGDTAIP